MKKIFLILFITLTFSSTPDKKINTTKFYNINDRIPSNIYINEFTLDKDPVNQINHYYKKQIFNNISVFGRSIKIHYNKNKPTTESLIKEKLLLHVLPINAIFILFKSY